MDNNQLIQDINDSLQADFITCEVSLRQWSARRKDKDAEALLANQNHSDRDTFNVTKRLMNGNPDFKQLKTDQARCRTYLYDNSLPLSTAGDGDAKRGARLIATVNAMEFMTGMNKLLKAYEASHAKFVNSYPHYMQLALSTAGLAGDIHDYPAAHEVGDLFSVSVDYGTAPNINTFQNVTLPPQVAQALGNRMAKRQTAMIETAMDDLIGKLTEKLQTMATQYTKIAQGEKTRVYQSVAENVRTVARLVKSSNLTNDQRLKDIEHILDELAQHSVDTVKANTSLASDLARKASTALAKVTAPAQPEITTNHVGEVVYVQETKRAVPDSVPQAPAKQEEAETEVFDFDSEEVFY